MIFQAESAECGLAKVKKCIPFKNYLAAPETVPLDDDDEHDVPLHPPTNIMPTIKIRQMSFGNFII